MQTNLPNMPAPVEHVMVVPSKMFDRFNGFSNHFITGSEAVRLYCRMLREYRFMERNDALEADKEFRQPIPYIIVEQAETHRFLLATRSKKQGESRLWGKHTLGVGGHINPKDMPSFGSVIAVAGRREYKEETGWDDFGVSSKVGLLITNDTEVDKVHVGVVYHVVTENKELDSPEKDMHAHRWASEAEINSQFSNLELWSQVVFMKYLTNS